VILKCRSLQAPQLSHSMTARVKKWLVEVRLVSVVISGCNLRWVFKENGSTDQEYPQWEDE
jgi:hypothetical protein